MKKTVFSIVVTALISCFIVFFVTKTVNKISDLLNKKPNDSISSNISDTIDSFAPNNGKIGTMLNEQIMSMQEDKFSEYEILESVEKAQLYLSSSTITNDILVFHKTKLNNLYKIKGLSKETNTLLLSTIIAINEELNKLKVNKKTADSLKNEINVTTDTLPVQELKDQNTINLPDTLSVQELKERDTINSR